MKIQYAVALAVAVGFGLGAAAIQGLHAQAKPPVYVVAEIDVTNAEAYTKEFVPAARASIKNAGGKLVAVSPKVTALEGTAREAEVTYLELAKRLKKHGFKEETEASITNKLKRGSVSATFFLACLAALGLDGVALEEI
jgi:uncharacterized protein (DUF1330 family)